MFKNRIALSASNLSSFWNTKWCGKYYYSESALNLTISTCLDSYIIVGCDHVQYKRKSNIIQTRI